MLEKITSKRLVHQGVPQDWILHESFEIKIHRSVQLFFNEICGKFQSETYASGPTLIGIIGVPFRLVELKPFPLGSIGPILRAKHEQYEWKNSGYFFTILVKCLSRKCVHFDCPGALSPRQIHRLKKLSIVFHNSVGVLSMKTWHFLRNVFAFFIKHNFLHRKL